MKVRELIEELRKLPQEVEVTLEDPNGLKWKFELNKQLRFEDGEVIIGSKNLNLVD